MSDRQAFLEYLEREPDQVTAVHLAMKSGRWWTKAALAQAVKGSPHSMSARMSELRKAGANIERHYMGQGVYAYRMVGK